MAYIEQMEEGSNIRNLIEHSLTIHNERATTPQQREVPSPSGSRRTAVEHQALDSSLLPQVPLSDNPAIQRAPCSARGEPAIHISPPIQDSTLATCHQIVGLLGQITDQQDGIMRELRAMHREMRLMKGEQRRISSRVVSVAHDLEALKEHFQWR